MSRNKSLTKKYESGIFKNYPNLEKEWSFDRNTFDPSLLSIGSERKIWWKCKFGHEWAASVRNRTVRGTGCPYCKGQKVCRDNSLLIKKPELSKQWNKKKNFISPSDVTEFSAKKVWWLCEKGHEWQDIIAHRSSGRNCPYCSSKRINSDNNLLKINPKLAKEWHYDKNSPLKPSEIAPNYRKKVWWKCSKGHEWQANVYSRNLGKHKCPYCSGRLATSENCLLNINPVLAAEWHPFKNKLNPNEVKPSSNKRAWWICKYGHEWNAIIKNRNCGSGCPKCWNERRNTAALKMLINKTDII